jgi:hypothetical protein
LTLDKIVSLLSVNLLILGKSVFCRVFFLTLGKSIYLFFSFSYQNFCALFLHYVNIHVLTLYTLNIVFFQLCRVPEALGKAAVVVLARSGSGGPAWPAKLARSKPIGAMLWSARHALWRPRHGEDTTRDPWQVVRPPTGPIR